MATLVRAGALFVGCWIGLAQAQVNKCEIGGRVSFQDTPCAPSERSAVVSVGSTNNRVATRYYDVQGDTYQTLHESLSRKSNGGFHGSTNWQVNYQYETRREGNLCRITSVRFTLEGEIRLPRWQPSTTVPEALKRRWEQYIAALEKHEQGHVRHADELIANARQHFFALGAQACESLQAQTQSRFNDLLRSTQAREREYDVRTSHGTTQGAIF